MISVVIADDQALVRAGFRALLDAQADITVTGEAVDGDAAVSLAVQERPDVVLTDIRMPGADGLVAIRRIAQDPRLAEVKVIILTTFDLDEYVFEAIRSGANGFLVKDTEPAELLRAIRAVVAGDALLSPGVTRRLIEEFATRAKDPSLVPDLARLTDREREGRVLGGGRPHQRRDRGPSRDERGHGQDPREPGDDQDGRTRPGPAGGVRLRGRPGAAWVAALSTPAGAGQVPLPG